MYINIMIIMMIITVTLTALAPGVVELFKCY